MPSASNNYTGCPSRTKLLPFALACFFSIQPTLWADEPKHKVASELEKQEILELPLEELVNLEVVSASRFKQKSSEAPSAVEVLTAEDIKSFNWRTLADALNAIRGLTVRNDRNYTFLNTRGFSRPGDYNARTLIMIDGRRMNEDIFDQGFIGEEFLLDMNMIERIEYIPGSGSAVYGANALLGVINVITKKGSQFNGFKVSGEAGSLDTYRGRGTFGKKWGNGVELVVNGSQFFSHGADKLFFPEFAKINGGIAEDGDLERASRVFGKLSYKDFTLRAGYSDRYKRVPTASFGGIFNDKSQFTNDNQTYVDLDYNTEINPKLNLQARGFYHWYDYYGITPFDANAGKPPVARVENYDAAHSNWWGGELKLIGTQFDRHKWIAGLDVQYDQRQHLRNFDIDPFTQYNNSVNRGWRVGVYAQDEYKITDDLTLDIGLRLDHHHLIKTLQLNPRVGLIWDITPELTGKFVYGSAFRAPNIFERDYLLAGFNAANPNNREERIKSYEATAEWRPDRNLKLLGTFFHNDLSQVLLQNPANLKYENLGNFQMFGFELQGEKRWDNGRLLKLSWLHQYTRDETSRGGWATDSPKDMVKLHYAEPLFDDRLRLGFEEIFIGERRTLANRIAPSYHLFNINITLAKPFYGVQASLGIYNVLDQHFKILGGSEHVQDTLAMDGRTVRFRLEYGF